MVDKNKKINLLDLVDIIFLQDLQDNFAKALKVGVLTFDDNGPITKPSNFTDLCKYTRETELGKQRCYECNIESGKLAAEKGAPITYTCHVGLTHFVVPIMVKGQHIASIFGGQISTENLDKEHFRQIAKELGINEEEYLKALEKIKVVSDETIKPPAQLLFLVANAISKIAHEKYEILEKKKKEDIYINIVETMRSSLDVESIKHKMVFQIGTILGADRVAFADYDSAKGNYFISPDNEYRSSSDVKTFVGYDFAATPGFIELIMKVHLIGKDIIFSDLEKYLEENNLKDSSIEKFYKEMGFLSSMVVNINNGDLFYGNFIITFKEKRDINEDDIKFTKMLANQAGIAIYQAELYEKTKEQAEREALLRSITGAIRSTLDVDETKKTIVEIIGKTLNADRCYIAEYDTKSNRFLMINDEYLSSDELLGYKGLDINKELPHFAEAIKKGQSLLINDKEIFLNADNQDFDIEKKAIEKYKINSAYTFPLYYHDELLGALSIHYVNETYFINDDEIKFLNIIANQIAIAIYQSRLYQKIQLQSERERISRNIIEILRSTLDKTIIKHLFVKNIGKFFNADRVFFSEFDSNTKEYLPVDAQSEYLSKSEEQSFVNCDLSKSPFRGHIQPLIEKRELIIPSWDEYIRNNPKNEEFMSFYKQANIKSSYNFPVIYEGQIMGYFCIEFTHKIVELFDEDISRIRSICTQAGTALHHAALYMEAQDTIQEKEKIITKVLSGIKQPVDVIMKSSKILSELELKRDEQTKHLNNLIISCNQLLDLTKDIVDKSDD